MDQPIRFIVSEPLKLSTAVVYAVTSLCILRAKCDAIITATDPIMLDRREQIAALAERNSLRPSLSRALLRLRVG